MIVEQDPAEAGFDPQRLARIDRHFQRYVDDGKLPGFLAVVARDGKVVHVARAGLRDVEARPAGRDRHALADLLDDQADHVGRGDAAVGGGRVRAQGPGRAVPSRASPTCACGAAAARVKPVTVARDRADPDVAPADAHRGADLRLPLRPPGRRDLPRATGSSGARRRASTWPRAARRGRSLPLVFEPGSEWNYSVATDVLGRVVEVISGQTLDAFFARAHLRTAAA